VPAASATDLLSHPLRHAGFRWFLTGRTVSLLGSAMSSVALAFAVLQASGSAGELGVVLAAHSIPMVALVLAGGVVADRASRRTVLLVSHVGAGLTQGAVAWVLLTGRYDLVVVAGLGVANGALQAFTSPALRGIVPELVPASALQRANALLATSRNSAKVLGPTLAGLLAATAGGGWAIAVDAVSYLLAAGCLALLPLSGPAPAGRPSVLADLREGWTTFRGTAWLWTVTAAFAVVNVLQVGVWFVLGPAIAQATFGAAGWGLVLSCRAGGLLVMGLLLYRVAVRRPLRTGQLAAAVTALPLLVLGSGLALPWLAAAATVAGLGSAVVAISWETALQRHVPRQQLSRVAAYDELGSFVGVPIGQGAAAPVAALVGEGTLAVVAGVLYAVVALLPLAARSVRSLGEAAPVDAAAAPAGERGQAR